MIEEDKLEPYRDAPSNEPAWDAWILQTPLTDSALDGIQQHAVTSKIGNWYPYPYLEVRRLVAEVRSWRRVFKDSNS